MSWEAKSLCNGLNNFRRMTKEWRFILMAFFLVALLAVGTFLLFYLGSP